jgi:hypothetical protein
MKHGTRARADLSCSGFSFSSSQSKFATMYSMLYLRGENGVQSSRGRSSDWISSNCVEKRSAKGVGGGGRHTVVH